MALFSRIRKCMTHLRHATSGVAVIEFALAAPIFVIMSTAGLETANMMISRLRIQTLTAGTADNASRIRRTLDETDLIDVLAGAKKVGLNLNFANKGRIIVSAVVRNAANNGYEIKWQRCDGAKNYVSTIGAQGKGKTDNSLQSVGIGTNTITPVTGTAIVFVETAYDYQPLFGTLVFGPSVFKDYRSYIVRERPTEDVTNFNSVTAKSCTVFSA